MESKIQVATKFKSSIDNFRGIAILFVMLGHLQSVGMLNGKLAKFYYFLFTDASTWFVFISGYLFIHVERERGFVALGYFWRKLKFVVTPYLFLSIPAISAGIYFSRDLMLGMSLGGYVGWSLMVGGSVVGPLWFIPMSVVFFLVSPALIRVRVNLFWVFLTGLALTFSLLSFRPYGGLNPLLSFFHFFGFYIFGMLVASAILEVKNMPTRSAASIAVVGVIVFLGSFYFAAEVPVNAPFFSNVGRVNFLQLGKFALLVVFFMLFEKIYTKNIPGLSYLAGISFGLFFVHGFFILLFKRYLLLSDFVYLSIFIELFVVVLASIFTVVIIRKIIGYKSRYVIGA